MRAFFDDLEKDQLQPDDLEDNGPISVKDPWVKLRDEVSAMKPELDLEVAPQHTDATPAVDKMNGPGDPTQATNRSPPVAAAKAPLVDLELLKAQKHAKEATRKANLGKGFDEILAAYGGTKANPAYWDDLTKQGELGVADLKDQRASAQDLKKQSLADAYRNKDSPESKDARDTLFTIAGPQYVDQLKKAGVYDSITREDIDSGKVFNILKLKEETDARRANDEAKVKARGDDEHQNKLAMVDLIKKNYPGQDQEFLMNSTYQGLKAHLHELESARGVEAADRRTDKIVGVKQAGLAQNDRHFNTTKEQNTVSGWDFDHPLQPKQSEQMTEQLAGRDSIHKLSGEAIDLIQKNGGVDLNPNSAMMISLTQKLSALYPMVVKAGGYGQLTVGHQHLLDGAVGGDPSKLSNIIRNEIAPGRLPQMLKDIAHEADMQVDSTAKSLGGHKKDIGQAVKIRRKSDGKVIALDAAKAQKYLADPNFEKAN